MYNFTPAVPQIDSAQFDKRCSRISERQMGEMIRSAMNLFLILTFVLITAVVQAVVSSF
jgi:hypothetical protein